jgi:lipopolysaccharide/colanic/teichoic acid biosynthesis glycosyltransferase
MKRVFDLLITIVTAPLWLMAIAACGVLVAIKLGRPVFFVQTRAGRHGRPFKMIKFRSMTDARDAHGQLLPDDQRLTRFSRTLRSTSLDELPELFNVLAGDMSLVGPRPLLMQYLPLYSPEQARRHAVLPGVTGWSQINGRNAIDWDTKLALDVWYVDHRSLWLDFTILWKTVWRVVKRDGVSHGTQETMPYFLGSGKRNE